MQRGTGILNNELYIGRIVWNRLRYIKDPDTGRRVSRLNSRSEWVEKDVPHLRIVSDDVWRRTKERQAKSRAEAEAEGNVGRPISPCKHRRPRFLFSGLTTCAECGAGFNVYSGDRLACYGNRIQGICSNRRTIRREEVERRVLIALHDKMLQPELIEEFSREFTREMNRLRMEHRASASSARLERSNVQREIDHVVKAIREGFPGPELKATMIALQERKAQLDARLAVTDAPIPLLHPNMAEVYRDKIHQLRLALEREDSRIQAAEAIRGLIDGIVLTPEGDDLKIVLKGNLAAMLGAAQNAKRSPETGDLECAVMMVAGAGFEPATFGL